MKKRRQPRREPKDNDWSTLRDAKEWYPGAWLGLDPAQEFTITGIHPDVNGAHGGILALMLHLEDRAGNKVMLVYRLSYCYGDVIPPIETPLDIVCRDHPNRYYQSPTMTEGIRIDRCVHKMFADIPPFFELRDKRGIRI